MENKKSISVIEMGKMLGLKKVASYWLLKKNYFSTVQIAGKTRILLDSFEDWYAGQFHYKKVNGNPPGSKWRESTMSIAEVANLLGIPRSSAYDLIKRTGIETRIIDQQIRVFNDSFECWFCNQDSYKKHSKRRD